ncbi:RNA-dependent RNA polymerase [Erysiphe necator associated narnavirus 34]|nr:RNA-dependent RNA polymerase [Erysiphe necator associated narnavirus 34]
MVSALSEDSILLESRKHANLALVSLYTRLLTLEYTDSKGVLVTVNVPHKQREILGTLNRVDRKAFSDLIIGDYQNRQDLLVGRDVSDPTPDHYHTLYDRALYAWRAIGTTVLLNGELTHDALLFDQELLEAGIQLKKWFFHSCFSKFELSSDGRGHWPGLDKTITLFKRLGAWITYYGSFSAETVKPKSIDAFPGALPSEQRLVWMAGTLVKFREPWLLLPTKENIHVLATMAGFPRALPPASKEVAIEGAKDTYNILTTEPPQTSSNILDLFRIASIRVSRGMKKLPVVTHCSINATACYERTTEQGGTASYVVEQVNKLLNSSVDELFKDSLHIHSLMYDPFGRVALSKGVAWTIWCRRNAPVQPVMLPAMPTGLGFRRPMLFGYVAYRGEFLDPRVNGGKQWNLPNMCPYGGIRYNREIYDLFKNDEAAFYNETLGDVVSLWAFSEALQYGHFVDAHGNRVEPLLENLALFKEPGLKTWVQDSPVPAEFMALEEPGWKARCLTKNKSFVVILQALLRHPIAESIGSDGRCGFGLKSSHILWDFLKSIRKKKFSSDWYFVSTDLKSSTDLIPHDLLRVIWDSALPVLGLRKHPLSVLRNMIMLNHDLEWEFPRGNKVSTPHLCGSFMGEPVSFMGLSLYNLCVGEIANYCLLTNTSIDMVDPEKFLEIGPLPADYSAIVGDDRMSLTDRPGMFPITNELYRRTNGLPSPGKNTVSSVHGILAENHVFLDNGKVEFLDIIKAKMLTPSTRFHSDNRTSLIGKGSALWQSLEWYESTIPFRNSSSSNNARLVYTQMMVRGFFPKDVKKAFNLPISLPTTVGGINFPVSFPDSAKYFRKELNILWWLVTIAPIDEFFKYATRIRGIASSSKRLLKSDSYANIWSDYMSSLISERDLTICESFEPEKVENLYTLESVLKYLKENSLVPCSVVTGMPHVNLSIDYVNSTFGFMPIEVILEIWERQSTFTKAFTEGVKKKEPLSFHKYVGNLSRFWSQTLSEITDVLPEHSFKSMDDVHWRFSKRLRTLIHKDHCGGGKMASGATLFLRLNRQEPVVHTEGAWAEIQARSIANYVTRLKEERNDEIRQDGSVGASAPRLPEFLV